MGKQERKVMSFHVAACAGLDETILCKTMTLGVTICFNNNVTKKSFSDKKFLSFFFISYVKPT